MERNIDIYASKLGDEQLGMLVAAPGDRLACRELLLSG